MRDARSGSRRAIVWLSAGAAAGVALAAFTLVAAGGSEPEAAASPDAVALVNGAPITREALARFTAAIARERGRLELDPAEQRRILDRLIDEELLLQRGLALGLDRNEPAARRAIVSAVMDALTTQDSVEPDRAALEAFYAENAAGFTRPGRLRFEAVRIPIEVPEAEARARAAEIVRRAADGEPLAAAAADLAAPIDPPLPEGPIAVDALRDRIGGIVVEALLGLRPGEVGAPVRALDGLWVVRLVAREPDERPPLDAVLEPVRQAWLQRDHDERLRAALAEMRAAARVEIVDSKLAAP
jgi:parvulin-like peptidyl-prolyl isomerase